jgi:hypothetical protein
MQPLEQTTRPRGAGGTPGGIGEFLLGLGMAVAGGYWLTSSVTVSSGYWTFWGHNAFGLSLVPLVLGCGILFFNGKSIRRMAHDVRRGRDHRGRDHHEPAHLFPAYEYSSTPCSCWYCSPAGSGSWPAR